MPSDYNAIPTDLEPYLPDAVDIASSTNASPIVITTSSAHGIVTGSSVMVNGHLVNTAANGSHKAVVLSPTTLQLSGTTGNGVGAATGTIRDQGFGLQVQIPSDGDSPDAVTWTVPYEALLDLVAMLVKIVGWQQRIHAGGTTTVEASGKIEVADNGRIVVDDGGGITLQDGGQIDALYGSLIVVRSGGDLNVFGSGTIKSGAVFLSEDGALFTLDGQMNVTDSGHIEVESSGEINLQADSKLEVLSGGVVQVDAGGSLNLFGLEGVASTGVINYASGASATGTLADATTTTRTNPTVYSGDNGYRGLRYTEISIEDLSGSVQIDAWKHDYIKATGTPTSSSTRTWRFTSPPNDESCEVDVMVDFILGSGQAIAIKDHNTGTTLLTVTGAGSFTASVGAKFVYNGSSWELRHAKQIDTSLSTG
jgi:hypothetical protein